MQIRILGNNDLSVSALGLGCMGMSEFYGSRNDEESIKIVPKDFAKGLRYPETMMKSLNG